MLNRIKSHDIQIIILEYLKQNRILDIFKYSKNYHLKFNLTHDDYLSYFFNKIPSIENIMYSTDEKYIFKELKKYTTKNISNDILKKNLIHYCAIKDDFVLSLDNIYFDEIFNEKILLKQKKIQNIKIEFREYLSQSDITSFVDVENFLNKRIKKYNHFCKKLELLLYTEIFIEEIYFDLNYQVHNETFFIDKNKDMIEYKENMTEQEKNILINIKLKRAELINKILEKNCKHIQKLEYIVFDKENIDKSIIYPLVDIEKFVNVKELNLFILYDSQEFEHIFNLTFNLEKLKVLRIRGYNYINNILINESLSVYIKKEILDKLESLKIKKVRWFVFNNECFHFKNLKNANIEFFQYNDIININSKKYFHEEFLKGNISWEKLERLKINIPFGYDKIKKSYKNNQIRDFINIANLRGMYDSSQEFYQEFFNYIFKNQILYLKTNKENKTIDDFIIKIHDDYGMHDSGYKPTIKYEKKLNIVKITLEGKLYCQDVFHCPAESPLRNINLNNAKIDEKLDGFFIDNYSLEQFKKINELIFSLNNTFEDELKEYKKLCQYREIEKELKKKSVSELNDKIENINKKIKLLSQDNSNDSFENKLIEIHKLILLYTINIIKDMQESINHLTIKRKKLENIDYDFDYPLGSLFE